MRSSARFFGAAAVLCCQGALAGAVDELLVRYQGQGAGEARPASGEALWRQEQQVEGQARSCATCHNQDLKAAGRHAKTGKPIDPLAPSANPKRLTDTAEIEKWLLRNCKWTWGRECTAQEKADLLSFIRSR
jgi:hypothetical protein